MNNVENYREFKLLAIRPLKNISSDLLKGLQENVIYQFYNEYRYLDRDRNEVFASNKYSKIERIKFNPLVPSNLYGENISISAIVGQNGSGKSSLLEIFYYFLFEYSRTEGLLESGADVVKIDSKEFHFEFYYLIDDEIHCIEWDNINNFIKAIYKYNAENQTYERDSDTESFNKGDDYQIPIYNIVINYSIYGLNSNSDEDKWFDRLFIKNDGYQTPIVLNPYREDGNINVNREFELANSRLLKIFLSTSRESNDFNTSNLIKDISVDEVLFKLDINKNLKLYLRSEHTEIETIANTFESVNEYKIKNFFDKLYTVFKKDIIFRDFRYVYSRFSFLDNENSSRIWMDLTNLYVFKKIIKIVHSYKNYKVFENIFIKVNIGDLKSNSTLRQLFVNQYFKLFLIDEKLNVVEIIEDAKKRSDFDIDELKIIEKSLLKYFYRFYEESFINDLYENNYINNIDTNNYISIYDSINNFLNKFNELLNSKEIKHRLIKLLLDKLATDFSHITLKLRQVLNMQESNFFDNLVVTDKKNSSVHDDTQVIYFTVKKEYLSKSKNLSIEEIPNAFLEPIFKFNKSNANAPFELKYLSSGEQQLLHSTVSISYHIDNLLSIIENKEGSKLRSYQKINIILDEIELYNHPEYQREYIKNLIVLLSQQKYKGLSFNVVLSTHSPFILSDIPSQNILKLKDGIPLKDKDGFNSFGANIHDLIADEFFLDKGSKGAYVDSIINRFMKFYYKTKLALLEQSIDDLEDISIKLRDYENTFKLIGDPVIKSILENNILNLKNLILNEKV